MYRIKREREVYFKDWLRQLWRFGTFTFCKVGCVAGDSGKRCSSSLKMVGWQNSLCSQGSQFFSIKAFKWIARGPFI